MKRFVYASDIHGIYSDKDSLDALHKFTNSFKPDHRILGGDLWDFVPLREGASAAEKATGITEDYKMGLSFLKQWKPTAFLLGNHDHRLWRAAATEVGDGMKRDSAKRMVEEVEALCHWHDCPILGYDKTIGVHKVGDLHFIHGFCHGENALKKTVLKMGVSVVCGHCHTPESIFLPKIGTPLQGHMAGCLRSLDADYTSTSLDTLRWRHGFVYGFVEEKTGEFIVSHATSIDGVWVLPSGFKTF